jgi:MFS transporter, FSR family, fosmidomycin resistance protein
MANSSILAVWTPWQRDAKVMGLIGLAHMVSHFFQLIAAPLFPYLRAEFGLSFAALGFIMTVLFAVSGTTQALAGFAVDRYGAPITLFVGLGSLAAGAFAFAVSHSYPMLLLGAVFIGIGNGVFHPVDYSVLNHQVSERRLGPAYSVHGVTGSLGWALAPVFLVGLAVPFGWRVAILSAAVIPLIVIALLFTHRDLIKTDLQRPISKGAEPVPSLFAFMRLPAIWWCFAFFAIIAAAVGGIQNFAPTIYAELYALTIASAALSITVYMLASATGMLAGGWLAVRSARAEANITLALALSAIAAIVIGLDIVPASVAFALIAVMGFGSGLSGPSRDLMIRAVAPAGATGRVYGVVYSGLDLGIAVGPVVFGKMLDHGYFSAVFDGIALCLILAVLAAWRVARYAAK